MREKLGICLSGPEFYHLELYCPVSFPWNFLNFNTLLLNKIPLHICNEYEPFPYSFVIWWTSTPILFPNYSQQDGNEHGNPGISGVEYRVLWQWYSLSYYYFSFLSTSYHSDLTNFHSYQLWISALFFRSSMSFAFIPLMTKDFFFRTRTHYSFYSLLFEWIIRLLSFCLIFTFCVDSSVRCISGKDFHLFCRLLLHSVDNFPCCMRAF